MTTTVFIVYFINIKGPQKIQSAKLSTKFDVRRWTFDVGRSVSGGFDIIYVNFLDGFVRPREREHRAHGWRWKAEGN